MFQIIKESRIHQIIPDDSKTGLISEIKVLKKGRIKDLKVQLKITHGFIGDLTIQLKAPSGESITLHDRAGGNTKNLDKTFDNEALQSLNGKATAGTWSLTVKDHSPRDNGTLESWSLEMTCAKTQKGQDSEIWFPQQSAPAAHHDSVQECRFSGRVTGLSVLVDVEHPNSSGLQLQLVAPSGNAVTLHDYAGNERNIKRSYKGATVAALIGEQTKGRWKLRMARKKLEEEGKLRYWKISFQYSEVDNLKKVEGIGPKIESLLNGAGIFSWSRLSVTSPDFIKEVLVTGGDRFKMHNPASWPMQAEMAANGEWEKLNKWQDEHSGGKLN